jgi:hypothetical protein
MNEDDFRTTKGFKGYVSKPEITELTPDLLVKGSKNVLVDYASRVISRNGYQLYRQASGAIWRNLVSYYKLDSNSNDSVGSNNGSDTAISYASAGIIGNCATFNGTSKIVKTSVSGFPTGTSARSMNFWVKTTQTALQVLVRYGSLVAGQNFGLLENAGCIYFSGYGNDKQGSIPINDGNWHMVTVTYDGTTVSLYVDKNFDVSFTPTLNTTGTDLYLGTQSGSDYFFTGSLDELAIFSRALSASEISSLYNMGIGFNDLSVISGTGIKSSFDWDTSNGKTFQMRCHTGRLEFDWNGTYNLLKSGLPNSSLEFAKIWDNTEKIDVLLYVLGDTNTYKWSGGVTKLWKSTATTLTKQGVLTSKTTIAFVAGTAGTVAATITDSATNFLNAGFATGDTLYVTGSTANSRNFTIGTVTAGTITLIMSDVLTSESAGPAVTLHNGEPTWASARFLTAGTRKITYKGVDYAYTGGEATDTLTGLSAFPTVTLGDVCWQTVIALANPAAIPAYFKQDLIGVQLNQLILASTKSQEVYGSLLTDYTNFALTSPRVPGDPFEVTMDKACTCIVPIDNAAQTTSSLMFGGGTSEFFKLSFQLSQDNSNEIVRMIKLKTAAGSGLISKDAICPVKNATAYISREPTLDTLGAVENIDGTTNVPLSDLIKNDFDTYDFTNAHVKYWKRAIYIALPVMGIVLIYDLQRKLWQPPQYMPISRFAIISDWLYGHSSVCNETYKLFTGTDDNGVFIPQVARFAYNNGGRRDRIKNLSQYWSDGYISTNGQLNMKLGFGFDAILGSKIMTIMGNDSSTTAQPTGSTLGDAPLGVNPLGGSTPGALSGLNGMSRFWQVDTASNVDYTEFYMEYSMNTLGGQFAIVAHGTNQWDAGTSPVSHKK